MPVYGGHYDVNLEDDLGNGTFGVLYKGSDTRNGRNVAAKKTFVKRSKAKEMAQAEIRALKHIGSHPNIIQLYDSFTERDNIWMMLEYCNLGDLETYCEQNKWKASEVGDIVLQAATAVEFLHSRSPAVIHRDIKPANILLHRKDGEYIIIKLGDYGLSQIAEDDQPVDISFWYSDVGTLGYKAPEIYDKKKYTVAIDVFSLGTVVYALVLYCDNKIQYLQPMIDGKCPGQKMLETSTDLELEEIHHKDLYKYADIIKGMTKFDPAKRTAIEQVVVQFETLAENELYAAETVLQAGQEWETINLCFHEESFREGKTQELNGEDNVYTMLKTLLVLNVLLVCVVTEICLKPNDPSLPNFTLDWKDMMGQWYLRKHYPGVSKINHQLKYSWGDKNGQFDFTAQARFNLPNDPNCYVRDFGFKLNATRDDNLNIFYVPSENISADIWTISADFTNYMVLYVCFPDEASCQGQEIYIFTRSLNTNPSSETYWNDVVKMTKTLCVKENDLKDVPNKGVVEGCTL